MQIYHRIEQVFKNIYLYFITIESMELDVIILKLSFSDI